MKYSILIFFGLVFSFMSLAQVTIGSKKKPAIGALLDLSQGDITTKGLLLPRVNLIDLSQLTMGTNVIENIDNNFAKSVGILVYNVNSIETSTKRICPGMHIWTGDQWHSIKPYDTISIQATLKSTQRKFEYLESDPSNSNFDINLWPKDKQADAKSGKYLLGNTNTDNLVDNRGNEQNTYYTSRFYVGYRINVNTYSVKKSFNCDSSSTPIWIAMPDSVNTEKKFEDGIWMTQNLNTTMYVDGTPITYSQVKSSTIPYYQYPNSTESLASTMGRLYNWPAVINMGNGVGQTPDPGSINNGCATCLDVYIQGICADGWHVPSNQEWIDLFNGINNNISQFSTLTTSGATIPYTTFNSYNNYNLAKAMSLTNNSFAAEKGGFAAQYTGEANSRNYNQVSYIWSSSSYSSTQVYGYYFLKSPSQEQQGVRIESLNRYSPYTVRCIKDTK